MSLTNPATLSQILDGDVVDVRVELLEGVGFSNASLSRVTVRLEPGTIRRLVLKRTHTATDWTAARSGDRVGREAVLLAEPSLDRVWDAFACPYVAYASGGGEIGLLLDDLSDCLLPDVRAPLAGDQEGALIGAIATLHASFWDQPLVGPDWLARPEDYCDLVPPSILDEPSGFELMSAGLRDSLARGWTSALARLPTELRRRLTAPAGELAPLWRDLPWTVLHGDTKVANFAILESGRVAAFDWALAGRGPCAIDLGWYLAVNGSRLTEGHDQLLRRYRESLESALGFQLSSEVWVRIERLAVVMGARMLLWSKANGLDAGRSGAIEEWRWWAARLEAALA